MTRICKGKTLDNKPCKASAVVKKFDPKTGKKFDINFCQMHQPGKIKIKICSCPECNFHRKSV